MQMRRSRLSKSKQDRLIEHFVAGTPVRCAANLVGVNFKTAAYYDHRLRDIICVATGENTPFTGEVELDESYFGGIRKGKRGRGAAGKVPVFGILKRGGKVYTQVIPDAKSKTLMPIIQEKIQPDSIVNNLGVHLTTTLHPSYSRCEEQNLNADHSRKDPARQYRLYRLLARL
jgi:transposase